MREAHATLVHAVRIAGLFAALLAAGCADQTPWQTRPVAERPYDDEASITDVQVDAVTIRTDKFEAPTPTSIAGAHTISTVALRNMMISPQPPILIDVLGNVTTTIAGAVTWSWAAEGNSIQDDVQSRLASSLDGLSKGDKTRPLVIFCLSKTCWRSVNAVKRVVRLGYQNVFWYRGGRNAWTSAGLPLVPVSHGTGEGAGDG